MNCEEIHSYRDVLQKGDKFGILDEFIERLRISPPLGGLGGSGKAKRQRGFNPIQPRWRRKYSAVKSDYTYVQEFLPSWGIGVNLRS